MEPSQSLCILKRTDKRGKNGNLRRSHANLLDELSPLFTRIVDPEKPNELFLFKKLDYKTILNIGAITSAMYWLLVFLDTGAGSNFLRENHLTPFLKLHVVHEPEKT